MKLKLLLNRAIAGYILVGIAMLIGFLYLRFPGDAVADYLKASLASRNGDLRVSIDAVHPSFPPGVTLENVTISPKERPEATLHADNLDIRPGVLGLLQGRLSLLAAASGYGGQFRGQIDYPGLFPSEGAFKGEATFLDLRTEKCAWLRDLLVRKITGSLKGSLSFTGGAETFKNGTGNLDFTLTNGTFPLQESFLGFDKIEFGKVEAKVSYRNGALKLSQLTLTGEKLRCSLKGNILLAEEFKDSQLDLNGTLDIPVQGNKRVSFAISGTIENPKTRFM